MNSSIRVFPQALRLSNEMHALQKDQRPCCIWMTGLSGAGKSTLANALEATLYEEGLHTFLLDGDNVRAGLCSDLDMSHEGRSENIRRLAEVARLMTDAGLVVIVSAISPFAAEREAARARFAPEQFLSVYVSTPFAVCARRDPKGLYRAAMEGRIRDFTGLDSPYEAPTDADCNIDTSQMDLESAVACLRALVLERCRPR